MNAPNHFDSHSSESLGSSIRSWLVWTIAVLAVLGASLSLITVYDHVARLTRGEGYSSLCSINAVFDCAKVDQSPFSQIAGVPLGVFGSLFFGILVLLSGSFLLLRSLSILRSILFLSAVGVLSSLVLLSISSFFIGAYCLICIGVYLVTFLLFLSAWAVERTSPLLSRLAIGFREVLSFPITFFKVKGAEMIVSSFGLIMFALIAAGAFSLPGALQREITSKIPVAPLKEPTIQELFIKWNEAAQDVMPVSEEAGPMQDFVKGPKDAPITIVEFSDFECPACRYAYLQIEDLFDKYKGKIRLVYKNFPLDRSCNSLLGFELHKHACEAAAFARCAGGKDKFWKAVDYLFSLATFDNGDAGKAVSKAILAGADELQLPKDAIAECMKDPLIMAKIHQDIGQAEKLRIEGTPSIWINNKRLPLLKPELLHLIVKSQLEGKQSGAK